MKNFIIFVIINIFLLWTSAYGYGVEPKSDKELNKIYSEILCIGCEGRKTIDHSEDCVVANNLRKRARFLFNQGFDKDKIISEFNADNIAFIYQLPQEVIKNLNCPCACREKVWVCLASENVYSCPVIEAVVEDIRELKKKFKSKTKIIKTIQTDKNQQKYKLMIKSAIKVLTQTQSYDISDLPDIILDKARCTCECTETLRTCIEKMPWCGRVTHLISEAQVYLNIIGLSPEDVAKSIYAPCAKLCGKRMGGEYLGKNCFSCLRPVMDKAYYAKKDGKKRIFCCKSCAQADQPISEYILENVFCKVCPCKELLSECEKRHICLLIVAQKLLIKTWLLQGMSEDEIIAKFRQI